MKLIWKIFARDVRQSTRNVIAVIVAMGLVIVPALYAWYNIAASWDPYGNTKALKVAVANVDKGYKSDLMPITINVGETAPIPCAPIMTSTGSSWTRTKPSTA